MVTRTHLNVRLYLHCLTWCNFSVLTCVSLRTCVVSRSDCEVLNVSARRHTCWQSGLIWLDVLRRHTCWHSGLIWLDVYDGTPFDTGLIWLDILRRHTCWHSGLIWLDVLRRHTFWHWPDLAGHSTTAHLLTLWPDLAGHSTTAHLLTLRPDPAGQFMIDCSVPSLWYNLYTNVTFVHSDNRNIWNAIGYAR